MDQPFDPYAAPEARVADPYRPPHTRLGIASLALSGVSVACVAGYFVLVGVTLTRVSRPEDLSEGWIAVAGVLILGSVAASVLGAALGLAGLFRKTRRRALAGIGTLANLAILAVYAFFVVIAGVAAFSMAK